MPHLLLELSDNIKPTHSLNVLFVQLHELLAAGLPTQLVNFKSRCIIHPLYFIGDQNAANAFIHLTVKVLSGRSDSKKKELGARLLNVLNDFFKSQELKLNFSVEILDLDQHYFKN